MKKRILIVDDDSKNRKLVRDLLNVKGYETLEAENGREGVALAKKEMPDLILMDMQMPVMNGFEALALLMANNKTRLIPVICLTAMAMKEDVEKIREAGCERYITKPISTRNFIKDIETCLNERGKKAVNEKILVVDDEERNLRLIEAMLAPMGYDLIFAHDGAEAMEKAADAPPDLVLLDVMMPKMNGFEVARALKGADETRGIPIVMVTALSGTKDRVRAIEAGVDDFLSKPVDKVEVKARVCSLLKVKAYNDYMKTYSQALESEVANRTRQLQKALEKVKKASLDTIHRLSRAAEYKDEDTGAHILRMSNYSAAVAQKMGLNKKTVDSILYAAPLHDIGKIGTPDRILLKPGKLDADEWTTMKMHAQIGGAILAGSDKGFIRLGEVIAMTHHEKFNGTGYPKGLCGKSIPLAGRIVAIADVFDALTTKRPYKEPFSLEKSYAIIKEGRGSHFDPDVVDAFFGVGDEILSIRDKYRDEDFSHIYRTAAPAVEQ